MNARAKANDEFPARLENKVDFYNSFSELLTNGLKSQIPTLNQGEILHLHYLAAFSERNNDKVASLLAVDQYKRDLEKWIGI